jgi:DNA-binding NarL/FixJ family response regulator
LGTEGDKIRLSPEQLLPESTMAGKKWHSDTKNWTPVVKDETKRKADLAISMRKQGKTVKQIAKALDLSESRIYEYLRK